MANSSTKRQNFKLSTSNACDGVPLRGYDLLGIQHQAGNTRCAGVKWERDLFPFQQLEVLDGAMELKRYILKAQQIIILHKLWLYCCKTRSVFGTTRVEVPCMCSAGRICEAFQVALFLGSSYSLVLWRVALIQQLRYFHTYRCSNFRLLCRHSNFDQDSRCHFTFFPIQFFAGLFFTFFT